MDDSYYKSLNPYFGKWEIEAKLGEGGSGKVYLIADKHGNQVFYAAMKAISIPPNDTEAASIRAEHQDESNLIKYYQSMVDDVINEFQVLSKLRESRHVTTYEEHEIREHAEGIGWDIFIRQELLTPLIDLMATRTFDEGDVINIGKDICSALIDCEKYKIVHRDIKPENIFVTDDGTYKLGDFGIAKTLERTIVGFSKKGTYEYMAPEVYRKERGSAAVDIYSLGLVLYKLLNENRGPFLPAYPEPIMFSDREKALTHRLKGAVITPPRHGSDALKSAVLSACAYDPAERFKTASEFREALIKAENCKSENDNTKQRSTSKIRKRRRIGVFAAIVLAAGIGIAGYFGMQVRDISGIDSNVEVYIGESIAPEYSIQPAYLKDREIDFMIDGDEATVDERGKITGAAPGEATITMTSGRYKETVSVKVVPKVREIICDEKYYMYEGDKEQLNIILKPDKFADELIEYTASDESVVTVSRSGELTANSEGEAAIEISAGGFSKEIKVYVSKRPVVQTTVKKKNSSQNNSKASDSMGIYGDDEFF